jgi:hypothetical protein
MLQREAVKKTPQNLTPRAANSGKSADPILHCVDVTAWTEETSLVTPHSISYIAAGLGNKKISFPFCPHHSSYDKRRLSPQC